MSETAAPNPYAPRYWPSWLTLGLLWCLARLAYGAAMTAGDAIGKVAFYVATYRRHIVETNLRLCFPERSADDRQTMVRQNFRYTGRGVVELGLAAWWSDQRVADIGRFQGIEHIERARQEGRGVLLLGLHFTSLDLTGRVMLRHVPFQVIYRENKNPVIEGFMRSSRQRHFEAAIERKDVRGLIRALRAGKIVWYPPDQDYGRRHSVFAPLFGVQAATITTPARLARTTGAAVLPVRNRALTDGSGYIVDVQPELEDFPCGDDITDATRINAVLEDLIREAPEQYYWVHRRFKTRPDNEPTPYNRSRRKRK